MSDDFKVGDVVVRSSDPGGNMPIGTICRVLNVRIWEGGSGVDACIALDLDRPSPRVGYKGWVAYNFRKLPPAEPEFIKLIRSLKAPTKIREDA